MIQERRIWGVAFAVELIPNKAGKGPPTTDRDLLVHAASAGAAANKAQRLAKQLYKGEDIQVSKVEIAGILDD